MRKKYKIGYTTGVFDLFHIGHLNILKNSKKQCDVLVVGVTTDEEVLRVKNKTPIIPFKERIEIVESIKYVDHAIPETDTDKVKAWYDIKFDVLFKGDDWKGSSDFKYYESAFNELGVEIVFFPYTKGTSSTELTKTLRIINK